MNDEELVKAIKEEMIAAGADTLQAEYSGYGDSGDINSVRIFKEKERLQVEEKTMASLLWDLVCFQYDGFFNNEGGSGMIDGSLEDGVLKLSMHHETNIMESSSEVFVHEFLDSDPDPCTTQQKRMIMTILENMRMSGVQKLVATYAGEGDSGGIERIETTPRNEKGTACGISVQDLLYELIDMSHAGYEINEGGHGAMVFVVGEGKSTCNWIHTTNYTDSMQHESHWEV